MISNSQFIFVGGIWGELLSLPFLGNYFLTNIRYLKKNHPGCIVKRFMPPSFSSSWKNAEYLAKKIKSEYQKNQKPLILIGHSKGAQDLLLMLLRYPDLLKSSMIQTVISMQGTLNGSSFVDSVRKTKFTNTLRRIPGIASLQRGHFNDYYNKRLKELGDDFRTLLQNKFKLIKATKSNANEIPWVIKKTFRFLNDKHGKNDGLVTLEDQGWPFLKLQEFNLIADHGEMTTSWPMSNLGEKGRHHFMNQFCSVLNQHLLDYNKRDRSYATISKKHPVIAPKKDFQLA